MTSMARQNVSSGSPYEPIIGFSRAVRIGDRVLVGGTAPIGPDGRTIGVGDVAAQTRRCCEIATEALAQAGASLSEVARTRVFLVRVEDWQAVGQVHGEFFGDIRPVATMGPGGRPDRPRLAGGDRIRGGDRWRVTGAAAPARHRPGPFFASLPRQS